MQITNPNEKQIALVKIRELSEKLSGKDAELLSLQEQLKTVEIEKENKLSTFNDRISSIKDSIKIVTNKNKSQKNELQKELTTLKESLVNFEISMA